MSTPSQISPQSLISPTPSNEYKINKPPGLNKTFTVSKSTTLHAQHTFFCTFLCRHCTTSAWKCIFHVVCVADVWKGTGRGFWLFSRAKNPFSLPFQTPATQAKFHVRCGYTRFPLGRIAWVCSGFWSLSCLRLHPDKLLKVKSKLEPGFEVNFPVNIEEWHKL